MICQKLEFAVLSMELSDQPGGSVTNYNTSFNKWNEIRKVNVSAFWPYWIFALEFGEMVAVGFLEANIQMPKGENCMQLLWPSPERVLTLVDT